MSEPFRYAVASVDWRAVDWSKSDEEIAEKLAKDVRLVTGARMLYGPTLAPGEIEKVSSRSPRTTPE